jgi:hypothetical protein
MRLRHLIAPLVALLVAALLPIAAGGPATAWAASQHPVAPSVLTRPDTQLFDQIILPELSIDGPALASVPTGGTNESALAWTGTDPLHHLNVETSSDGLHFGHKLILDEFSSFRPDVAIASVGGPVSVAWTGTDPNHSLNVLYDVYGSPKKLTLFSENSFTAPALLEGPGPLWLAWTGTDPNHSLNILSINVTSSGLTAGTKTILFQNHSDAGPHLRRGSATVLDLSWASRALQLEFQGATNPAGLQPGKGLPELSASAPDTLFLGPFVGAGNKLWIGWTGTDVAHTLNLEWTTTAFPGTKTILADTALGGPALSYNHGNQIAWTGTDPLHHLNIARFA